MPQINDPQKHKDFYEVIINFSCVEDLVFLRIIN